MPLRSPIPLRLLIVDDDEVDRMTVARHLRAEGVKFESVEAPDATTALSLLATQSFDCLFLDFQLPREDGLHVLRRLRESGDHTPVVVLTGQSNPGVAAELMKSGASEYLSKVTLTGERLALALRQVLRVSAAEREARRVQEALRASEELTRKVLSASSDFIMVLSKDGTLLSINDGWTRALNVENPKAWLGQDWLGFWRGKEHAVAKAELSRAGAGQTGRFVGSYPGPDGALRYWDVVLNAIDGPDGKPEKVLAVARDITDIRQRQSFEEQLLGIVSHDLRNPLNAILLAAEVIEKSGPLSERADRSVKRIRSSGERAGRMIHDLLDFTRARLSGSIAVTPRPTDLAQLAHQVVDEVSAVWPHRKLLLDAPAELPGLWDRDRLAQVLSNLLSNALQYSPPGSPVTLRILSEGSSVAIAVHNEGAPIPADRIPSLFEPLQRGAQAPDSATRSIGLGLYIVRHLVHAHEGTISVTSTERDGTTFVVHLPVEPRVAARG